MEMSSKPKVCKLQEGVFFAARGSTIVRSAQIKGNNCWVISVLSVIFVGVSKKGCIFMRKYHSCFNFLSFSLQLCLSNKELSTSSHHLEPSQLPPLPACMHSDNRLFHVQWILGACPEATRTLSRTCVSSMVQSTVYFETPYLVKAKLDNIMPYGCAGGTGGWFKVLPSLVDSFPIVLLSFCSMILYS